MPITEQTVERILKNKITTKQKAWAEHYAVLNNAEGAARYVYKDARLATKQGLRNLHNQNVIIYVDYLRSQMLQQYKSTKQYCTSILKDIIQNNKKSSPSVAITAIDRLISLGGFNQTQSNILNGQISINIIPKTTDAAAK